MRDRRLAAIVRRCQDLPGQELFQYVGDDGEPHDVAIDDVNDYLREIVGADVTAKDFRTWAGTVLAYRALRGARRAGDRRAAGAAQRRRGDPTTRPSGSGNTPAVAAPELRPPGDRRGLSRRQIGGALLEAAEEQRDPPSAPDPDEEREVVSLLRARLRTSRSQAARSQGAR